MTVDWALIGKKSKNINKDKRGWVKYFVVIDIS